MIKEMPNPTPVLDVGQGYIFHIFVTALAGGICELCSLPLVSFVLLLCNIPGISFVLYLPCCATSVFECQAVWVLICDRKYDNIDVP